MHLYPEDEPMGGPETSRENRQALIFWIVFNLGFLLFALIHAFWGIAPLDILGFLALLVTSPLVMP